MACGSITAPTTRGYTSQEQMPAPCLVNLNARLYDPAIGKFMAADSIVPQPFDAQTLNRYSYVVNNPLRFTDPTGHLCDEAFCDFGPEFNGLPDYDAGGHLVGGAGVSPGSSTGGSHEFTLPQAYSGTSGFPTTSSVHIDGYHKFHI